MMYGLGDAENRYEHDANDLKRLYEKYGIHGAIAILVESCQHVGGLGFVQRVIADLTEQKLYEASIQAERRARQERVVTP